MIICWRGVCKGKKKQLRVMDGDEKGGIWKGGDRGMMEGKVLIKADSW